MTFTAATSRNRLIALLEEHFAAKSYETSTVQKTGTPVDNQIATWTDSSTIEGNAYLTYDSATGVLKAYSTGADQGDWVRFTVSDGGDLTIDTSNTYSTTAADISLQPNGKVIAKPNTTNSTTFFQLQEQAGTAFLIADSTNKIITKPYQPAFLAYLTSDQTLTGGGTLDHILFNAEAYDENNDFASSQFTAPKAGRYVFAASLRVDAIASAGTQWVQGKIKNTTTGRTYTIGLADADGGSDYETVEGTVVMDLAASDVVRIEAAVKSGASSHVYGQSSLNGDHRSYFSGYLLG